MKKIFVIFIIVISCTFGKSRNTQSSVKNVVSEIRKEKAIVDNDKNLKVVEKDYVGESRSTDGGIIKYYYKDNVLKKLIEELYSEGWRSYREYYIKDNKIYFVYEKALLYNVPYYVTKEMLGEEEIASEYFDEKKSKVEEKRYYFDSNENLVRMIKDNKINDNRKFLKDEEKEIKKEYKLSFENKEVDY